MLAPRFEDRDEWGTAKFSFDGNESGVFKPAEGAIFGIAVEPKL